MTKAQVNKLIKGFTEALAEIEVTVRIERLTGVGGIQVAPGLALVEDEWVIFLEKRQQPKEQLAALMDSLKSLDLSEIRLPPDAAAYLDQAKLMIS